MVNVRSLKFRLAVCYFLTVVSICALAAGGYWLAVRSALNYALDQHLRFRVMGLGKYLEEAADPGDLEGQPDRRIRGSLARARWECRRIRSTSA